MLNATFNNISLISWRSVLLVDETEEPGEYYRPTICHLQTLSHNGVSGTLRLSGIIWRAKSPRVQTQTSDKRKLTRDSGSSYSPGLRFAHVLGLLSRLRVRPFIPNIFQQVLLDLTWYTRLCCQVHNMLLFIPEATEYMCECLFLRLQGRSCYSILICLFHKMLSSSNQCNQSIIIVLNALFIVLPERAP